MPVPDPFSLADRFTDESSKDASSSSSDDEDDGVVVRANAPTEGITFNGSIHYREDLNPSLGRGRGLLWKRPTIIPRQPSPVQVIIRKSSSPAQTTTTTSTSNHRGTGTKTNNTRAGSGSDSDSGDRSSSSSSSSSKETSNDRETTRPPSTQQPRPTIKTMFKPTSTQRVPEKPPAQVHDEEEPKRPYHPLLKPVFGPARKTAGSTAPSRVPEGGHMISASQGQSSKSTVGSIFRPPSQTAPKAAPIQLQNSHSRYSQSQPQSQNPSSSISSQPPLRTASQTAPGQGQRPSPPPPPVSSSVFKLPHQPPRQPSSQAPPGHIQRETKVPPPNVGRNIFNAPSKSFFRPASQPTSGQVIDPQPRMQQPYPPNKVPKAPPQSLFRPAGQTHRSGLLLSQPTPSRLSQPQSSGARISQSQPAGPDMPQPLASVTLPPQPQQQPQPQMSTSEFFSAPVASISSKVNSQEAPATRPPEAPNLTVQDIESKLRSFIATVGEDHARYVEYLLDEAEQMAPEPKHLSDFDAFADMPALSAPATTSDTASVSDDGVETMAFKIKLHHGDNGKPRAPTKAFKCPVVKIKTDKEVVPKYRFHHTEIKKNILVPNTMLTFVPHLRDVDPDSVDERDYINWLNELEKLDTQSGFKTENRQQKNHKRVRDEFTATLSMYIEPWLKQLGLDVVCGRPTLIRYMLSQEENKAHITQQQKDVLLNTYKDDAILSPKAVEAARIFTLAFNNVFGNNTDPERSITLRDVLLLEKRETVVDEKRAKETPPPANPQSDQSDSNGLLPKVEASLSSYAVLGCNVCFSHDCEHGDIDAHNYHRTFSLDSVGGVIRALKRKWADQVASMGGDEEAVAAASKKALHLPCHNACYRHYDVGPAAAPVTPWANSEISVLEDMFVSVGHSQTLKAQCVVASILGRKCWEVYRKIKELDLSLPQVSPPRPKTGPKGGPPTKVKSLPWYDRRKKCLMGDWQDQTATHEHSIREITEPCHHDGPCTKENEACPCANASPRPLLCDRFCQCTVDECALKFTGCACHSTGKTCIQRQKEGKPCICIMLNRECDPVVCKGCGAKERADPDNAHDETLHSTGCQNVSLQRGASKTVLLGKSQLEGCGYGLFTAEDISQDEFVIEYTGELITHDEGVRREARRGEGFGSQGTSSYLFTLLEHEGIWVDAAMYGNLSRYINHASENDKKACNITPKIIYVNNEYRIKFTALRDIKAGEELFFNYGDNFPNLTKKLLQDQDGDGENDTATKSKGKRGSSSLAQGTARKATTKASTTAKGKAKIQGRARGARKTAVMEIPPSDDYEDQTWIRDPLPLYDEYDEDDDSYLPVGRKRRKRGGKRAGAGRKKKTPSPEEGEDQGSAGEDEAEAEAEADEDGDADADGDADGPSNQQTRKRRARAVSEISDSQAERDEDMDDMESEDSDAPLSPSRVTARRKRQLRTTAAQTATTTTTTTTTSAAINNNNNNNNTSRATSASASTSAYTTAASTSNSTPAPSQPGNGDGGGDGDDEAEGNQEEEEEEEGGGGQEKKRSNRGGARPGAGRKPRKTGRQQAASGSASVSASTSASESTTATGSHAGSHWDRLKSSIAFGSGSGSGSGSSSGSAQLANPHSGSLPANPSGVSPSKSKSKSKKRKAPEADIYSMDEHSSSASGSGSDAELSAPESNHVSMSSKKKKQKTTSTSTTAANRTRTTRSSRATTTKAIPSPATTTMKIKPLGVTVTRSPGGRGTGARHTSMHNAAAEAQIRAEQSLRDEAAAAAAAAAAAGTAAAGAIREAQQGQGQEMQMQSSTGLYHTAANFQPFTSDNDEDDGEEEDVASVGSGEEEEEDEEEEEEEEEEEGGEEGRARGGEAPAPGSNGDNHEQAPCEWCDNYVWDVDGDTTTTTGSSSVCEADRIAWENWMNLPPTPRDEEGHAGRAPGDYDSDDGAAVPGRDASNAPGPESGSANEGGESDDNGDDNDNSEESEEEVEEVVEEEEEEEDQPPVKRLRPRRPHQASPPANLKSTASNAGAPVVGGKVLRQRSSQSQSQSQAQSQKTKITRQSTAATGTKGTERKITRSTNTSGTATRKTSNPNTNPNPKPKASGPSKETRSSSSAAAAASVQNQNPTRGSSSSLKRKASGADGSSSKGSKGGEEGTSHRKRQRPLRYRNEEE
ncbi:uncharacterized protein B0T23DRAFT_455517 [Neurospora hispaniola]|uniref:SET domain-containing protein n=1 Tax=Neurospora hispaniola TaxID=588809 RepID=A0AAJ0MQ25_9PEZI|nr:hypothetical protein B0T23DRAFT_455517 [Neurospora hispaniola]